MQKRVYLSPPDLSGNELKYVQEALASNWVAPVGPQLDALVFQLKKATGAEYVLPVNSGTSAIHLALLALNVAQGDIVFCPTFTFAATVFPILYQKATPIFIDCEADTWNMDPVLLEQAIIDSIQQHKKPKAIILAHIYGFAAKIDAILAVAGKYNLSVIEDAAESLGTSYHAKHTGTFSEIGILSFNGNKLVTGGNGGAVLTNDQMLYEHMLRLSNQAKEDKPYYEHKEIGYNYRMCNVNAAIALAQTEQLDQKIAKKKKIRDWYALHLKGFATVKYVVEGIDNAWLTCILLPDQVKPEAVQQKLEEHQIESRRLWNPMNAQPVFEKEIFYSNGIADSIYRTGLCLPSGTQLNEEDIIHIADIIKRSL
ncbi:DegT/DnrJ/EryC1/StrS family aminotransferase [Cytophaga aurantiaca]|uniref:DegT/DnrJ/EryC1/StrS family aminotransferase n=1 Tax=Cytophaga aurantiaca TaxID=29530 RepID=UPI0003665F43|nr:DegT/DnrJ/EryC1/StrS family aminotransferase [Cytophaga aurantiaca]